MIGILPALPTQRAARLAPGNREGGGSVPRLRRPSPGPDAGHGETRPRRGRPGGRAGRPSRRWAVICQRAARSRRSAYPLRSAAGSVDPAFLHGCPRVKSRGIKRCSGEVALAVELLPDRLAGDVQGEQFIRHVADAGDHGHDDDLALAHLHFTLAFQSVICQAHSRGSGRLRSQARSCVRLLRLHEGRAQAPAPATARSDTVICLPTAPQGAAELTLDEIRRIIHEARHGRPEGDSPAIPGCATTSQGTSTT